MKCKGYYTLKLRESKGKKTELDKMLRFEKAEIEMMKAELQKATKEALEEASFVKEAQLKAESVKLEAE